MTFDPEVALAPPPHEFDLPAGIDQARWQIKIYDNEPPYEKPHVTIIAKSPFRAWRVDIRALNADKWVVMDLNPPAGDIPRAIKKYLEANVDQVVTAWDAMYPKHLV